MVYIFFLIYVIYNYFIHLIINKTGLQIRSDQSLSGVQLFATPWAAAHQAPLSIEFSWQEYWSGLLFPPPGDLPHQGN